MSELNEQLRAEFEEWASKNGYEKYRESMFAAVEWALSRTPAPQAVPSETRQPIIGRLMDAISNLPVLWGLNEPGALLRNSDVQKVLVEVGKEYAAVTQAAPSEPVAWWRTAVICNDAGYAIGLDEPEFRRDAETPGDDIDGVWYPLYAAPLAAQQSPADARDAALEEAMSILRALYRHASWDAAMADEVTEDAKRDLARARDFIERADIAASTKRTVGR